MKLEIEIKNRKLETANIQKNSVDLKNFTIEGIAMLYFKKIGNSMAIRIGGIATCYEIEYSNLDLKF